MFGKGIYFANAACKSLGYSDKYMFLSNVSLGKSLRLISSNIYLTKEDFNLTSNISFKYNSVYGIGKYTHNNKNTVFNNFNIPIIRVDKFNMQYTFDYSAINIKYIIQTI